MSIRQPGNQIRHEKTFAPTVDPFSDADLALVRRGMAAFAPEWSVELQGVWASQSSLLNVPENGDDDVGPISPWAAKRMRFGWIRSIGTL